MRDYGVGMTAFLKNKHFVKTVGFRPADFLMIKSVLIYQNITFCQIFLRRKIEMHEKTVAIIAACLYNVSKTIGLLYPFWGIGT